MLEPLHPACRQSVPSASLPSPPWPSICSWAMSVCSQGDPDKIWPVAAASPSPTGSVPVKVQSKGELKGVGGGESHLSPSKRRKQHQRGPTARQRLSCRKSPTRPTRGEEKRTACSHLQKENVDTLGSGVGSCTFSCGKAKQTGPHHQRVLKNDTLGNWPFVMQEDIKRPMNLEEHTRDKSALSDGWKSTCGPADESLPRV